MRALYILTVVAAACALAWVLPGTPGPGSAPVADSGGLGTGPDWGFYQIYWGNERFGAGRDAQLETLGGAPRYVMFFRDLLRPFPTDAVRENHARGLVTILSLELWIWGHRGGRSDESFLTAIAEGAYDDFFRGWGEAADALGLPVLVRFGFEMNGGWFSWGQQPEAFRKAWRRAWEVTRAAGGDELEWVFAPNVLYDERGFEEGFAPYYPGDAYVDHVALDGYNFGDDHSEWHAWQSYDEIFGRSLDLLDDFGKPLFISEIGCADDPRKPAWIEDFLTRVSADARVRAFVWFQLDKRRAGEHDWRLESDPESLEIFRRWAERQAEEAPRK